MVCVSNVSRELEDCFAYIRRYTQVRYDTQNVVPRSYSTLLLGHRSSISCYQLVSIQSQLQPIVEQSAQRCQRKRRHEKRHKPVLYYYKSIVTKNLMTFYVTLLISTNSVVSKYRPAGYSLYSLSHCASGASVSLVCRNPVIIFLRWMLSCQKVLQLGT